LKLPFEDGSSVCDRLSGSERVMRVSDEAHGEPDLGKLSKAAKQWVFE
jgi:phosphoglucomutase